MEFVEKSADNAIENQSIAYNKTNKGPWPKTKIFGIKSVLPTLAKKRTCVHFFQSKCRGSNLKAALNMNLVNKLLIVTCFRLSIFSVALFSIAQLFAQPGKLSQFNVYLPISY